MAQTGKEILPKHGPDCVYFGECLVFPHNSLLVCVKVVCFWAFPTAFFTTQVKVDVRSSEVMFFNHKLLWRMAPSSKPDLKTNIRLSFVPSSDFSSVAPPPSADLNSGIVELISLFPL